MEDYKSEVNRIVLAKFNEEVSEKQKEEYIKQFANLVHLVPSLNSFKWGRELALANFHEGFTHVFELTFESAEGVAEYAAHPDHVDFAKVLMPKLEKFAILDFKTTNVPS